ncbi:zf-HC2 domain-containing protein [Streptomyces sp. CAU 1734]|uniref:anti-sigma factor family protein n=1 Tax=Streptomyces sp. CAU 1734 TaxID=3140360 RepID=UPI0032608214
MSGTSPTPAEQHLGDRLAALVDGELKHDVRDRVLAHLATCPKCKAEADAQRRLKDVFAQTAPPPPSEGLLARLQGLPAGPGGGDGTPFGPGPLIDSVFGGMSPPSGRPGDPLPETFGYVPGGHRRPKAPSAGPVGSGGFRIHDVGGRAEAERSAWRGRRFAFAAASAVSFAAIALGGALPLESSVQQGPRAAGSGNTATPPRVAGTTGATGGAVSTGVPTTSGARSVDYERRRGGLAPAARSDERVIGSSVPGLLTPGDPRHHAPATPTVVNSVFAPPPLIRPTGSLFELATAPGPTPPATPAPSPLVAPSPYFPPLTSR